MKEILRHFIYKRFNISFSKAGEDLQMMKLIANTTPGVYVDIGCWHPVKASNTYFFYLRNWKGICIDPNPELKALYSKIRPNDIFENCALGNSDLNMNYYMLSDRYSSMNTVNLDFIKKHNLESEIKKVINIPTQTLKSVLEKNISKTDRLDFFDVDVEGYDLEVLKTNDWDLYRPRFIVVESDEALQKDLTSEMNAYLNEVNYTMIGKIVTKDNLGNLFYIDNTKR